MCPPAGNVIRQHHARNGIDEGENDARWLHRQPRDGDSDIDDYVENNKNNKSDNHDDYYDESDSSDDERVYVHQTPHLDLIALPVLNDAILEWFNRKSARHMSNNDFEAMMDTLAQQPQLSASRQHHVPLTSCDLRMNLVSVPRHQLNKLTGVGICYRSAKVLPDKS